MKFNINSPITMSNVRNTSSLDSVIYSHLGDYTNPHQVSKSQVGLGNVDDTADNVKNVLSAAQWTSGRTITLDGDVTGSVSINGTSNVTLTTTVDYSPILATANTWTGVNTFSNAEVYLSALPTTAPAESNRLWNDSGTIKIT